MRTIVHISDTHFGQVDPRVVEMAVDAINRIHPDVLVVSGDLTQRARRREFVEARNFLDRLPTPQIVVPGNHDVPLYNIFDRALRPLDKFKRFITSDLSPTFVDRELAIIGVNTTRSLTIKDGRINDEQIARIRSAMCPLDDKMLKIVVTHHPFDLPEGLNEDDIVGRAGVAMPLIADCGADVFLAGHLHVSHVISSAKRYKLANGRNALVVQAGTATSVRARGEPHSFNVIEYEHPTLSVTRVECNRLNAGFEPKESRRFQQSKLGWSAADQS